MVILLLLAARAALRLGWDRLRTGNTADRKHRTDRPHGGEAAHFTMAVGMALLILPLPAARPLLAALFVVLVLVEASIWAAARVRRLRSGRPGPRDSSCSPGHSLELHHVVVGSAMAVMALRSSSAVIGAGSAGMAGMTMGTGPPDVVSLTLFAYVWLSVFVLGGGLARAFKAEPDAPGLGAILAAPSTFYACELAMTVVMGLMLLA